MIVTPKPKNITSVSESINSCQSVVESSKENISNVEWNSKFYFDLSGLMEKTTFQNLGLEEEKLEWKSEKEERRDTFDRIMKLKQRAYERALLEERSRRQAPEGVELDDNFRILGKEAPKEGDNIE